MGEKVIILEDLDKNGECLGHHLKLWADKYAITGEVKGSTLNLNHQLLIVTSNYTPEDIWIDEKLSGPIRDRFRFIHLSQPRKQERLHTTLADKLAKKYERTA